jgi:HK97 family phage major capsid protein
MTVPIVRPGFGDAFMPREIADFIFEKALKTSAVMQLAQEEPLPTTGKAIPIVTGNPAAGWVSEGGRKPVSDMTIGTKTMDPKKLAVIVPFSKEYARDPRINVINMLRPKIAEAFAKAFDSAALKGTSTPFSNSLYQTTNAREIGTATQAQGGVYGDFVSALSFVTDEGKGYRVNGWAVDDTAESILLGATDTTGRPLFISNPVTEGGTQQGSIVGRPAYFSDQIATPAGVGNVTAFGADWTQVVFGVAEEIAYDVSNEASIVLADGTTVLHLWQNNLSALLAEAEFGFIANDVQAGVKLTNVTP